MMFIDLPRFVPLENYERAIARMCDRLVAQSQSEVVCIYQIGHVSTAGISDLDMVVVFKDDTQYKLNPLRRLSRKDRYLFVHSPIGISRDDYADAARYSFFHNYRLLWGNPSIELAPALSPSDEILLKRQTALEYLVRMYVILFVEIQYRVLKLRSLFLQAKALLYDCEFLEIFSGPLHDAIQRIVTRRNAWFTEPEPPLSCLTREICILYSELERALDRLLHEHPFYVPPGNQRRLGCHIRLIKGRELRPLRRGVLLPPVFGKVSRRFVNLQHRLNRFEFVVPFDDHVLPPTIERFFELRQKMAAVNQRRFPHFMTLSSGLALR